MTPRLASPARAAPSPAPPVVVISERALVRDLLVDFLHHHGFPQARAGAGSLALFRALPRRGAGLVVVDVGYSAEATEELMREVRGHRPEATLIAIGSPTRLAAHAGGADGWIELSDSGDRICRLAGAVQRSRAGRAALRASPRVERELRLWSTLTRRQREILALLGCGVTNRKLAATLGITERTVKAHVAVLLDKFKVDNRTELALVAHEARLRSPDEAVPLAS
jgi:DNA-binding NarL/FixJ family response regulator